MHYNGLEVLKLSAFMNYHAAIQAKILIHIVLVME